LQLTVNLKTRSFPVLDRERRLVGIISREDVTRALRQTTKEAQQSGRRGPALTECV